MEGKEKNWIKWLSILLSEEEWIVITLSKTTHQKIENQKLMKSNAVNPSFCTDNSA